MLEVYIVYNYLCVTLYHRDVPASRAPAWCGTWDTVSMELRISSLQTVLGAALEIVPWFLHPELKSPFSASVRCNEHVSLPDDTSGFPVLWYAAWCTSALLNLCSPLPLASAAAEFHFNLGLRLPAASSLFLSQPPVTHEKLLVHWFTEATEGQQRDCLRTALLSL